MNVENEMSTRRTSHGIAGSALALVLTATSLAAQEYQRVSVDSTGAEGDDRSDQPAVSADGRFVAFSSTATNLVAGDTNGVADIFVRDRTSGATTRVSVDSAGAEADWESSAPSLSGDGRYVAFTSVADNLVPGDTNHNDDVFVHDRDPDGNGILDEGNGVTVRVSVDSNGVEGNNASNPWDWDSDTASNRTISDDGSRVVFWSFASNLVPGDTNGWGDVFVHDLTSGATTRVSVSSTGGEADHESKYPTISNDGAVVAFESDATNLVSGDSNDLLDVFVRDLARGTTTRVSVDSSGSEFTWWRSSGPLSLSAVGDVVVFMGDDESGFKNVFIHEQATGLTEQITDYSSGDGGDLAWAPSLSADGIMVAYEYHWHSAFGWPMNGGSIRVFDRVNRIVREVAKGLEHSYAPAMGADGMFVAFGSDGAFVSDDTNGVSDVFVYDLAAAWWSNYGRGYYGTWGEPTLTASDDPVIGTSITVDLSNSRGVSTSALFFFGISTASVAIWHGDAEIVVDPLLVTVVFVPDTGLSIDFDIPDDPTLVGLSLFAQALELDPGADYKLSLTPGLQLTLGSL